MIHCTADSRKIWMNGLEEKISIERYVGAMVDQCPVPNPLSPLHKKFCKGFFLHLYERFFPTLTGSIPDQDHPRKNSPKSLLPQEFDSRSHQYRYTCGDGQPDNRPVRCPPHLWIIPPTFCGHVPVLLALAVFPCSDRIFPLPAGYRYREPMPHIR